MVDLGQKDARVREAGNFRTYRETSELDRYLSKPPLRTGCFIYVGLVIESLPTKTQTKLYPRDERDPPACHFPLVSLLDEPTAGRPGSPGTTPFAGHKERPGCRWTTPGLRRQWARGERATCMDLRRPERKRVTRPRGFLQLVSPMRRTPGSLYVLVLRLPTGRGNLDMTTP